MHILVGQLGDEGASGLGVTRGSEYYKIIPEERPVVK